jgi:hypothetical protein
MSFPFDLHSAAVPDSHLPCHAPAMLWPCRSSQGHSAALPSLDGRAVLCCGVEKNGMVRAWHGHGLASVNQTRLHCANQMGKTHSKLLAAQHGMGTAWARHGHGMLCVNRPLWNGKISCPYCESNYDSSVVQLVA